MTDSQRDPRMTSLSTWGRKLWEVEIIGYQDTERLAQFLSERWEPFGAFEAFDGPAIALRRRPGHVDD